MLFVWTVKYWCIYWGVFSPSAHLFPGHASCCQHSDRLIHAVFTVPNRLPSGLSPLCSFFYPSLLFFLLLSPLHINHQVHVRAASMQGGAQRKGEAMQRWHWAGDAWLMVQNSPFLFFVWFQVCIWKHKTQVRWQGAKLEIIYPFSDGYYL